MRTLTYYFLVLDIETSKTYDENGDPIGTWLSYGFCNLYGIDGTRKETCYFREWDRLSAFFNRLRGRYLGYKLLCFVHNLSYEFDYIIKNLSRPKKMLSNSTHNVITSTLLEYNWIEFRCTYQVSGYALRTIGEQLGFPKLESEYQDILPNEEVPQEDMEYCMRDCDIVAKYVVDVLLKEYDNLVNIPYTKTGRVRKKFHELYEKYDSNADWDLMPPEDCYDALNNAFCGGLVIVNPVFCGLILRKVRCFDETSAYPYTMLKERFPRKIRRIYDEEKFNLNKEFWIAKIKFYNIESKYDWQWLSISKMNDFSKDNSDFFNGKLIYADWIERTITSTDYKMILETYSFDKLEILEYYDCYEADYLPKCYIELLKLYAKKKYELKQKYKEACDTYGELSELTLEVLRDYMLAKNDYNSIYGMCVEKLIHSDYTVDENFVWKEIKGEYKYKPNKHLKRNFLFGLWVTAYARRNLLKGVLKNCPDTLIYCDTDSIKGFIDNEFIDTNEPLDVEFLQYDYLKDLGKFDDEGTCDEFKTYGAKKYAYKKGDQFIMHVAGVPVFKEDDQKRPKEMSDFYIGKVFEDCKLGKKYINNDYRFDVDENGNICNIQSMDSVNQFFAKNNIYSNGGVALYPVSYLLSMTNNDIYWANFYKKGVQSWLKRIEKDRQHNISHLIDWSSLDAHICGQ